MMYNKRLWGFLLYFLIGLIANAQIEVSGIVVEEGTCAPLAGASVILRSADGKIKNYSATNVKGEFNISTFTIKGLFVDVSVMNFAKHTIMLDSVKIPIL